jgi:hypothetical protein
MELISKELSVDIFRYKEIEEVYFKGRIYLANANDEARQITEARIIVQMFLYNMFEILLVFFLFFILILPSTI